MKGQAAPVILTMFVILGVFVIPIILAEGNPAFSGYKEFLKKVSGLPDELLVFPVVIGAVVIPFIGILAIITFMLGWLLNIAGIDIYMTRNLLFLIALSIAAEMIFGPTFGFPGINTFAYLFASFGWIITVFFFGILGLGLWMGGKLFQRGLSARKLKKQSEEDVRAAKEAESKIHQLESEAVKIRQEMQRLAQLRDTARDPVSEHSYQAQINNLEDDLRTIETKMRERKV